MKFIFAFVLSTFAIIFSGCINTAPATSTNYPRLYLISLYEDHPAIVSDQSIFHLASTNHHVDGFGKAVANNIKGTFERAGYRVTLAPMTATEFWSHFEETAKSKEGSSSNLNETRNLRLTIENLVKAGRLNFSDVDAVLVVGPFKNYSNSIFLSRDGEGISIGCDGYSWYATMSLFDAKTLEPSGYGRMIDLQMLKYDGRKLPFNKPSKEDVVYLSSVFLEASAGSNVLPTGLLKFAK